MHTDLVCPPVGLPPIPIPLPGCPRSWVPSKEDTTQTGRADVHHQGNLAGQGTDDGHHGADQSRQCHGIGRSIRPGTTVPSTVLVADMCDGGLFLQGWRDGPSAYLSASDASALRCELAAAFGRTELAQCRDPSEAL